VVGGAAAGGGEDGGLTGGGDVLRNVPIYLRVIERRDDSLLLEEWEGTTFEDWLGPFTVSAAGIDYDLEAGDVVEETIPEDEFTNLYRDPLGDLSAVDEDVAAAIAETVDENADRLPAYDVEHDSLADGDVVVVTDRDPVLGDVGYVCVGYHPLEVVTPGEEFGVGVEDLLNCPASAIEPGMAFDVHSNEHRAYALRFDAERTRELQDSTAVLTITDLDEEIYENDLEPPVVVDFTHFDDGSIDAKIHDNGPAKENRNIDYRLIGYAIAYQPWQIPEDWVGDCVLEPDEILLEENEYADHPVALIPRDTDPIALPDD
jgi:hypothetical protein